MSSPVIFLDAQASTPEAPEVLEAMAAASIDNYANPHSEHAFGRRANRAVETSRALVAELIGCDTDEVIFTSGATESNNIALQGISKDSTTSTVQFITSTIEHKSISETCLALMDMGIAVNYCPVDAGGIIRIDSLREFLTPKTKLVSIMWVNNEIGVIQDIKAIVESVDSPYTVIHSDIAQAVGKLHIDVKDTGLHMASLSAHKLHGPKGIGALYISKESPARPAPLYYGGGQESGLRPGTLPVPLCVGFGVAAMLAKRNMDTSNAWILHLRDRFLSRLRELSCTFDLIGSETVRVPHNLNLRFQGVTADILVGSVQPELAISTGSACASGEIRPSHVLTALGLSADESQECIRIGFHRGLAERQVVEAAEIIATNVVRLRFRKE